VFKITYSKVATRTLIRMSKHTAELIRDKVTELATDPHAARNNVGALKGRDELRLRIGDWCVIFTIDGAAGTARVRLISPCGSAYR